MRRPPHLALFVTLLATILPTLTWGHGRMIEPSSRMSAYLAGFSTKPNYEDNEMNCGGIGFQWDSNQGRCGICGDPWSPTPRPYERPNGEMVQGKVTITKTYLENQSIKVTIQITQNHKGWYEFRLCDVMTSGGVEATHECLDRTLLADETGKTRFESPPQANGFFDFYLVLPAGLTCSHCVLQWKWKCGNNWGCDAPGDCAVGKGARQEEFYACADVKIDPRTGSAPVQPNPNPNPNPTPPIRGQPSFPNPGQPQPPTQPSQPSNPGFPSNPNKPKYPGDSSSNPGYPSQPSRPTIPSRPTNPGNVDPRKEYFQHKYAQPTNTKLVYQNKIRINPFPDTPPMDAAARQAKTQQFVRDVIGYPTTPAHKMALSSRMGRPHWALPTYGYDRDAVDRLCAACHLDCRFPQCASQCGGKCLG